MLDFVTFQAAHADLFEPAEAYKDFPALYAPMLDRLGAIAQAGTHMIDKRIMYLSGFYEVLPGNWEVIIIPSIHLPNHKKAIIKDIRMWLKAIHEKTGCRRLQTYGEPTDLQDRWLTCLGFKCDGTMPEYDVDGDKRMWSITTWQDS